MKKLNLIDVLALLVTVVGAVNWGIVSIMGKNAITDYLGLEQGIADIVYIVVGACGVWTLVFVLSKGLKKA